MLEVKAYQAWDAEATTDVSLSRVLATSRAIYDDFVTHIREAESDPCDAVMEALEARWHEIHRALPGAKPEASLGEGRDEGDRRSRQVTLLEEFLWRCLPAGEEAWRIDEPVCVLQTQLTLAVYLPRYVMAKALADVFGSRAGIERMQTFIDDRIARRPKPTSPPERLRELRDRDIPWNLADGGQNAISALRSETQLLKKVTACRIHRVLEPYGDPELMETIACYPDFASIRKTNEHFALTRTQNLIRGGDCCDTCFHDRRGGGEIVHPSQEIFDGLDELAGQWVPDPREQWKEVNKMAELASLWRGGFPELRGAWLGQSDSGDEATELCSAVFSPENRVSGITFNPEGSEAFFSLNTPDGESADLMWMRMVDGLWTTPKPAVFNSEQIDNDVCMSPAASGRDGAGEGCLALGGRPNGGWMGRSLSGRVRWRDAAGCLSGNHDRWHALLLGTNVRCQR